MVERRGVRGIRRLKGEGRFQYFFALGMRKSCWMGNWGLVFGVGERWLVVIDWLPSCLRCMMFSWSCVFVVGALGNRVTNVWIILMIDRRLRT